MIILNKFNHSHKNNKIMKEWEIITKEEYKSRPNNIIIYWICHCGIFLMKKFSL